MTVTTNDHTETTDVIICGCGPTGALLSALLGQRFVNNVVLELEKEVVTDPRGIALDEEGIRLLQQIGVYDKVHSEIGETLGRIHFISGKQGLITEPFMEMDMSSTEGGTGHVGAICHKQPVMEEYIRQSARRCPSSVLRLGATIMEIQEDGNWVRAKYLDDHGKERWIRAKFFVGADGKTGFTRKRYLEPKGVVLETVSGYEYQETWVAVNYHMDLPTPETHPDFPLWKLNHTPEDVYDAFFPTGFRFIGNPDRPSVCGTFGPRKERLWRFEFVVDVDKGEDPNEMATYEKMSEVIFPYLTHPGQRYGLNAAVQYPTDCMHLLRSRPFSFSARSCNKWSVGRVLLCGDSAHVMPPFGGQGIASGFRDAAGVAWRLALACRPDFKGSHERLFNGWCLERKQQLDRSIAVTVANGNLTTARSPLKIFVRDWILCFMRLVPSFRRKIELGPRALGMVRYQWKDGMAFLPDLAGGRCLPQVYCRSVLLADKGDPPPVQFTDDVIFHPESKSTLRLVVLVDNLEQAGEAHSELASLDLATASNGEVGTDEACYLVMSPECQLQQPSNILRQRVYRIATGEEFQSSTLCENRPPPVGYDMYRIKTDLGGRKYVLVRPDRFVFAACYTGQELVEACRRISRILFPSSEGGTAKL
ncbi:putative monooxygenase [Exophiala viscosa]|uniref:Monooxygenase n=1 Tax=Exophiala viscosa TaxID=2486360 RepID=A0AAN6ICC6_9EURO|nr:putative monooxygenase [Exophiala viscosa]